LLTRAFLFRESGGGRSLLPCVGVVVAARLFDRSPFSLIGQANININITINHQHSHHQHHQRRHRIVCQGGSAH